MKLTDLIKDETRKQLAQKKLLKKFRRLKEKAMAGEASKKEMYKGMRSNLATEVGSKRAMGRTDDFHRWVKDYLKDNPNASNRDLADEALKRMNLKEMNLFHNLED